MSETAWSRSSLGPESVGLGARGRLSGLACALGSPPYSCFAPVSEDDHLSRKLEMEGCGQKSSHQDCMCMFISKAVCTFSLHLPCGLAAVWKCVRGILFEGVVEGDTRAETKTPRVWRRRTFYTFLVGSAAPSEVGD